MKLMALAATLALLVFGITPAFAGTVCGDADSDTIDDCSDNCSDDPNPDQDDTDGDDCGNLCDADYDQAGTIGFGDFAVWFQIAERFAVGHIHRCLWRYRLHDRSLSRQKIESVTHDYYKVLTRYCDGYLERWPGHAKVVDRWRACINRYLFCALAFEVGLHFRRVTSLAPRRSHYRTVFEIADYRLTPEEFHRVLEQLRVYRTGFVQRMALSVIDLLLRLKFTWPLAWVTDHSSSLRGVLGLR